MGIARRVTRAALRGAGRDLIAVLPGRCRGATPMGRRVPVICCGPPWPALAPGGPLGPREGEYQQGRQANDDARRAEGQAEGSDMIGGTTADHVRGRAHDDESQAQRDRYRAADRQGEDERHPPGGGIRAHWSTIASWFARRKPYRQARALRLVVGGGGRPRRGDRAGSHAPA